MSHRAAQVAVAFLALTLTLTGCSRAGTETPPPAAFTPAPASSGEPGASASQEVPGSPIAGIVTSIDSTGLDQVHGFTLRTTTGRDLAFVIGTLESPDEFPAGHLAEHLAAASPVLVFFKVEDDRLVVYRLEDAG